MFVGVSVVSECVSVGLTEGPSYGTNLSLSLRYGMVATGGPSYGTGTIHSPGFNSYGGSHRGTSSVSSSTVSTTTKSPVRESIHLLEVGLLLERDMAEA